MSLREEFDDFVEGHVDDFTGNLMWLAWQAATERAARIAEEHSSAGDLIAIKIRSEEGK